ncbi:MULTISPECIES: hypothetical protein [unclassified Yoonia]|uniref:hypothetical protein n=1 Tax=unclassified Yoonia TaxID=2629118 RepID=UPI002B0036F5|nr:MULTISPECIES: hypothetical protein [unclassified Yoonia]
MNIEDIKAVMDRWELKPLRPSHQISLDSRLVHDLGISGDDFDELLRCLGIDDLENDRWSPIKRYIPTELSFESFFIAMARTKLARKFPLIREFYLNQLKSPDLSVGEFLELAGMANIRCCK